VGTSAWFYIVLIVYRTLITELVIVVNDHLALPNLTGPLNPLLGPLASPSYARFLPLSSAYSVELQRQAFLAAHDLSLPSDALGEGTYAWVSGPTYETAAEGRFLRAAGADVVGMSTVPEVVAAKDEGLNVLVLSLATNPVVIPDKQRSIKEEVEAEVCLFFTSRSLIGPDELTLLFSPSIRMRLIRLPEDLCSR
jgi:purine-nucleoside phosphorylase